MATMTDKGEVQLPWELQLQNAIAAPAINLLPFWWIRMLISDARDRRRNKWRIPTIPKLIDHVVPAGMAPGEIETYLNGLGIQTSLVGLLWTVEGNQIELYQTLLVPGRQEGWSKTAMAKLLSGDPIRRSKLARVGGARKKKG